MLDFNAGKYAFFVWPAYGLTLLAFVVLIGDSLSRTRRWKRVVQARERSVTPQDETPESEP